MARSATSDELVKFRSDGQASLLYLAVDTPAVIFKARVNQTFQTLNEVAEIVYDSVTSGAYTDVLPGMTLYVGSSDGAYDLGMCRIRKTPTSSVLYISEGSEIAWDDNLYLTVVNEFAIRARHIRIVNKTILMDYDVAYSDQHQNCDPVPVLGPDWVVWLRGSTVNVTPDASGSWVIGSTISSYLWTAPGASATSNLDTATPTITYNAPGIYRIGCTVTAGNGKTMTGYRFVYVYSDNSLPVTNFILNSCAGDYESGGWSFQVTLYDEAARTEIRDRTKVILFAKDYYQGSLESIGPIAGRENIVCEGWVAGETITRNPDLSTVTFEVFGPHYWINKISGFATGLEDTDFADNGGGNPNRWTEMADLDTDKAIWHFLHWRTTAPICIDIPNLTGNTWGAGSIEAPTGTLWQQILTLAEGTVLAKPVCDRYGRLFVEIDSQLIPEASRSSIPVVLDITSSDWRPQLDISRITAGDVGQVELSGVRYSNNKVAPIGARSPGNIPANYGVQVQVSGLIINSQEDALSLAGLYAGKSNNEYPQVTIPLASTIRLIDIAPLQYMTMSMQASENERGIVWTAKKLIPRSISYSHIAGCALMAEISCEAETFAWNAVAMEFPGEDEPGPESPGEPEEPPQPPDTPPEPPEVSGADCVVATANDVRTSENLDESSPTWSSEL